MADLDDVRALEWGEEPLPEDFQPLEAIVLVKGVYVVDGDLTRSTWVFRWTKGLADNQAEQVGVLDMAKAVILHDATSGFIDEV